VEVDSGCPRELEEKDVAVFCTAGVDARLFGRPLPLGFGSNTPSAPTIGCPWNIEVFCILWGVRGGVVG
jgi:hypothetical protein